MYGITETTVHVTFGRLTDADVLGGAGRSPVGVPLPGVTVYVCNPAMRPQPVGVAGEIYVGGSGVSRGYLRRPALEAQPLLYSPFRPGERLYRTGDLGRWREGGTLDYVGRNDDQVKVRGFRVEPGEIEAALCEHPGVGGAAVAAHGDPSGAPTLTAYVVPGPGPRPDPEGLRRHLRDRLPPWMVPAAFVALEALPLTANGKVDRARLPRPDPGRPDLREPYVAPRGDLELVLTGIFAQALGVERVGANDSFFDLGGHSLSATRVVSRVREVLWA